MATTNGEAKRRGAEGGAGKEMPCAATDGAAAAATHV